MGDVACYIFVVAAPFDTDEPFSEVPYSIVKLAAECQEEFGSVHNNTPTGFTYYTKTEEMAKFLKHIHRNHLNHLDSISLMESTTKNEKEEGLNVLVKDAAIEQLSSGIFRCENVRQMDEGFENGI